MKKFIGAALLLSLTGCFGTIHVTVYGASGKAYTAPDLCAAQLACKQAGEKDCYYVSDTQRNADGSTSTYSCKAAK